MDPNITDLCPIAGTLAERLRANRHDLTLRWLQRIAARVSIDEQRIFPTEDLLNHVPILIDGIADYLEDPVAEVSTDMPVVAKAMELGALRHEQGFDANQIHKEYELLGAILFSYLSHEVEKIREPCRKKDVIIVGHRLYRAISVIQHTTTLRFLLLSNERVAEREERLRLFNRAISHELKNRLGAVLGAADLLVTLDAMHEAQRRQLSSVVFRNAREMKATLDNLVALSRLSSDARQQRHVRLPRAIAEVTRQLRETTSARRVEVRVVEPIPDVEVNAAAVELCLANYVSNALKYADRSSEKSWAEISAELVRDEDAHEVVVRVRDNGLSVPAEKRGQLFHRFFRAHEQSDSGIEGTGLGLSIVRDTVEALGGRAWAEFPDDGTTVFAFALPSRRDGDAGGEAERRVQASGSRVRESPTEP